MSTGTRHQLVQTPRVHRARRRCNKQLIVEEKTRECSDQHSALRCEKVPEEGERRDRQRGLEIASADVSTCVTVCHSLTFRVPARVYVRSSASLLIHHVADSMQDSTLGVFTPTLIQETYQSAGYRHMTQRTRSSHAHTVWKG